MAFPSAGGYGNLAQGNFVPAIFSQKVIKDFRKVSVVDDITNTDYSGEISQFGDTVHILQEPDITVGTYARGQALSSQNLDDDAISLVIDKANQFQFAVDDIEKKHSHVNWMELATNRAAYKLVDRYDSEILTHMYSGVTAANSYGTSASPTDLGFDSGEVTPMTAMNRLNRFLDVNNVPKDGRWFAADPYYWELAGDENSKLLNQDHNAGGNSLLRNGRVADGMIRGFNCYTSNNLPTGVNGGTTYYVALAGHKSSTCTASQLAQVETFRSQSTFADVTRGLHLYGRKILRAEALVALVFKID